MNIFLLDKGRGFVMCVRACGWVAKGGEGIELERFVKLGDVQGLWECATI